MNARSVNAFTARDCSSHTGPGYAVASFACEYGDRVRKPEKFCESVDEVFERKMKAMLP